MPRYLHTKVIWRANIRYVLLSFLVPEKNVRETQRHYSPAAILHSLVSPISTVRHRTVLIDKHVLARRTVNCVCFMVVNSTPRQTHVL
jgi:hypothetical protein